MKKFEVSFRPLAEADLFGLYGFIAEEAGHEGAGAYIDRIEAACLALETFPGEARGAMTSAGGCEPLASSGEPRLSFK